MFILYAGGKAKGLLAELCHDYLKRLTTWRVILKEVEGKEWQTICKKNRQTWIMWHETGHNMTSPALWKCIEKNCQKGQTLCFFVGEKDGIPPFIFQQKDDVWAMGHLTWPHLWARAMILEQLYRGQSAQQGHPYSFL